MLCNNQNPIWLNGLFVNCYTRPKYLAILLYLCNFFLNKTKINICIYNCISIVKKQIIHFIVNIKFTMVRVRFGLFYINSENNLIQPKYIDNPIQIVRTTTNLWSFLDVCKFWFIDVHDKKTIIFLCNIYLDIHVRQENIRYYFVEKIGKNVKKYEFSSCCFVDG